ncbi:hypothetical protein B1H10_09110 [candidate division KSB1 bacterium 4484_188]|nr:MAG: hypothetical protein B1H10_09110 [candidate division KSB1 bacterium 4484_188]
MFGMHRGMGRCYGFGAAYGMGPGFGRGFWFDQPASLQDEAEWLKRYRDRLQLHRREMEAELKAVEARIAKLEK